MGNSPLRRIYTLSMSHTELDVLRLLAHDAFGDPAAAVQVYPGALPEHSLLALAHLDAFILLGSVQTSAPPDHSSTSIFFSSPFPVEDSERLLGEVLASSGWTAAPHLFPRPAGFLTQAPAERDLPALAGPLHQWVHHASRSVAYLQGRAETHGTNLTLRLEQGPAYTHHARQGNEPWATLPVLIVPPGITAHALGGSAGMGEMATYTYISAILSGEATTSDLQIHFAGELLRQGWVSGDMAGGDTVSSSLWQLDTRSGVWLGTLTLTQMGDGEWQAQFGALQRRTGLDGNFGWSSYTI